MAKLGTEKDRQFQSFTLDENTEVARRVIDTGTHNRLDTISGSLTPANTSPSIFNVNAAIAATEYSQALPANTKSFIIRARTLSTVQFTFTSGQSGTVYMTIPAGCSWEDNNFYTNATLYFQASQPGDIEIIAYV